MFIHKFFINTYLNFLINQKIMNILWNARASCKWKSLGENEALAVLKKLMKNQDRFNGTTMAGASILAWLQKGSRGKMHLRRKGF
jgi:mRNA-degrading endonuclease RelE of RelBE toxin-antitoxin system